MGGAGISSRIFGLLCDYVEEVEVVLANSSIVRTSRNENQDLFFAMRGASSSYGIATNFAIRTEPAPPSTVSYSYAWTASDAASRAQVFKNWQKLLSSGTLPREISYALVATPTSMVVSGVYFGSEAEFASLNLSSYFSTAPQIASIKV